MTLFGFNLGQIYPIFAKEELRVLTCAWFGDTLPKYNFKWAEIDSSDIHGDITWHDQDKYIVT